MAKNIGDKVRGTDKKLHQFLEMRNRKMDRNVGLISVPFLGKVQKTSPENGSQKGQKTTPGMRKSKARRPQKAATQVTQILSRRTCSGMHSRMRMRTWRKRKRRRNLEAHTDSDLDRERRKLFKRKPTSSTKDVHERLDP